MLLTKLSETASMSDKHPRKLDDLSRKLCENQVIIFCDPGVDDIIMLSQALSSAGFNRVKAIIACAGNVPLEITTMNVLGMLDLINRNDIPVYMGNEKSSTHSIIRSDIAVHGNDGLGPSGRVRLPTSTHTAFKNEKINSDLIPEIVATSESITIVSTAGLTDVYHFLEKLQMLGCINKIAGISMMGGVFDVSQANAPKITGVRRYGEFNLCCDPNATKNVFKICSKYLIPIILASLDITSRYALYGAEQIQKLRQIDNPVVRIVTKLLEDVPEAYINRFKRRVMPVHDLFSTMCLFYSELFEYEEVGIISEDHTEARPGHIRTLPDGNFFNVYQLTAVNCEKVFYELFERCLSTYPQQNNIQDKGKVLFRSHSPVYLKDPGSTGEDLSLELNTATTEDHSLILMHSFDSSSLMGK